MSGKYDDMLDLPRPDFPNHPRMPVAGRAAIDRTEKRRRTPATGQNTQN